MLEERARRIFGKSTHLKLLLLFYNDPTYFENIEGLAKKLGKSHVTTRKVVNDLCKVGILKDFYKVRKGGVRDRIVMLNKSNPYTKALFNLLKGMEVCAIGNLEERNREEMVEEMIEKGKERRSRIVQELFKLYDRVRELEEELDEEIAEILKRLDEDDFIVHVSTTLEGDLEYLTKRGKIIFVTKDGSVAVQARNGTYIIGQRAFLL